MATSRKIKLNPDAEFKAMACPQCKNTLEFTIHSEQVCEDGCEVWAVCKCGFDPSEKDTGYRMESVMGGCSDENCIDAIDCWNYAIRDQSAPHLPA